MYLIVYQAVWISRDIPETGKMVLRRIITTQTIVGSDPDVAGTIFGERFYIIVGQAVIPFTGSIGFRFATWLFQPDHSAAFRPDPEIFLCILHKTGHHIHELWISGKPWNLKMGEQVVLGMIIINSSGIGGDPDTSLVIPAYIPYGIIAQTFRITD